ncbi:glycosyltransferase 87 family protein [Actinokineospora sp. 24-640]
MRQAENTHWITRWGFPVLAIAGVLHATSVSIWSKGYWPMVDLEVYRDGALAVLRGTPLYEGGVTAGLKFVYPPFAAILFTPLTLIPLEAIRHLWLVGNVALLGAVIAWCWRRLAGPASHIPLIHVVALFTGALFLLDAVRVTVSLGQVNLVLMAVIVWDLLRNRGRKWQGVGIGLAAAVKLTPLIFVVYLLVTRRYRAAAVAVGTLAATVAIGFTLMPAQSIRFWLRGAFGEVSRINPIASGSNHSLRGTVARLLGEGTPATAAWLTLALAAFATGLFLAHKAYTQGNDVLGLSLCGLTGAAVSPFSWTHHWIWLVPFLLHGAHLATTGNRGAAVFTPLLGASALAVLTGFPDPETNLIPPSGLASLDTRLGLPGELLAGNIYVLSFAAILIATAAFLRTSEPRPLAVAGRTDR